MLLRGEGQHTFDAQIDPGLQLLIRGDGGRVDIDVPFHGPAGEVHDAHMVLGERIGVMVGKL